MQTKIDLLGALAFAGLYSDTVEFNHNHIDAIVDHVLKTRMPELDKEITQLSFLRTSNPTSKLEDRRYHFLHLTLQEFFAARYFVKHWSNTEKPLQIASRDFLNTGALPESRYNFMIILQSPRFPCYRRVFYKSTNITRDMTSCGDLLLAYWVMCLKLLVSLRRFSRNQATSWVQPTND